jgi:hypothetical protein
VTPGDPELRWAASGTGQREALRADDEAGLREGVDLVGGDEAVDRVAGLARDVLVDLRTGARFFGTRTYSTASGLRSIKAVRIPIEYLSCASSRS